jgi:hypothetical protein
MIYQTKKYIIKLLGVASLGGGGGNLVVFYYLSIYEILTEKRGGIWWGDGLIRWGLLYSYNDYTLSMGIFSKIACTSNLTNISGTTNVETRVEMHS